MTDVNYKMAIECLQKRYNNRSIVIQSHIRSLLEAPYVEQANSKQLQALLAHVHCIFFTFIALMQQR